MLILNCESLSAGTPDKALISAFDGLDVEPGIEQTALVGEIRDQSDLYVCMACWTGCAGWGWTS